MPRCFTSSRSRLHHRAGMVAVATAIAVAAPATAQTPPAPHALTLEQALELAVSRSETIAAARAGVTRSEGQRLLARSSLFPQVSAVVSYDRALASEFEGVFNDINPGTDSGASFGDLPFGRENTWRVNLSFSQSLFSGGRIRAQQAMAEAGRTTAEVALRSARAQLVYEVTRAYYDAALSDSLVAIAAATLDQAEATVRLVEASYQAGTQPEFELLRARVTRDNQRPALIRQRSNQALAQIRLKQLLDLPASEELRLAVSLDDAAQPPAAFADAVFDIEQRMNAAETVELVLDSPTPSPDRAPVAEASATVQQQAAAVAAARSERMPSAALNSNYGRVGYPTGPVPTLDRTNWTVGFSINVPVLTGGRLRANEIVARADLERSQAELQYVRELADVDTRTAWAELLAARAAWEATGGTIEQARRANDIAVVRYREGVSTQLELSDARLLLQQAEANRAQAARDLQLARARVALIRDLPLGTSGAPSAPVQPSAPMPAPAPVVPFTTDPQTINASGTRTQPPQGVRGFSAGAP